MSKIVYITERRTTVTRAKKAKAHDPAKVGAFEILGADSGGPFVIVDATIPAALASQFAALWENHLAQSR